MSNIDLPYSSQLVAASVQNRSIYQRVWQVGIRSDFFEESEFDAYLFKAAGYLQRIGNPFTLDAFESVIRSDENLPRKDRQAFISQLRKYYEFSTDNTNLALDKIKRVHKERLILNGIKMLAQGVKNNEDPSDTEDKLRRLTMSLETTGAEFEFVNYFETFGAREEERQKSDDSVRFRFLEAFEQFRYYWPRGINTGTTTSISGPTYVGKSVVLCNLAYQAVHPDNGMDTVFIAAENMLQQVGSRFDAIFLDRPETNLERQASTREDVEWFQAVSKDKAYGKLFIAKVPAKKFDANTIRSILDSAIDAGANPKVLLIDSPDHQNPISRQDAWHLNKGEVYYDNKAVAEEYDLVLFASTPMKASSVKTDHVTNEHVAGSYDIARVVDNQIMFKSAPDDRMLGRARLVVTKNRVEGITDERDISFRFKESRRLIPYEESFAETQNIQPVEPLVKPARTFGKISDWGMGEAS